MMMASTTIPSRSSRSFSSQCCSTALKVPSAGKVVAINQGIFYGVVAQGPPVLHQVNP